MNRPELLPLSFYTRSTLEVARDVIGKILVHRYRGRVRSGRIVEAEAYTDDPASHAHRGLTRRNGVMFGPAGVAYVYFIYGMYYCFNIVTEREGTPGAVLIRALEPLEGIDAMRRRRSVRSVHQLANGPGKLCEAMAIGRRHSGMSLLEDGLFLVDDGFVPPTIRQTPRIGIRAAADRPWRFILDGHPCVTPSKLNRHVV